MLTDLVVAFRDHLGASSPSRGEIAGFLPRLLEDPSWELCVALDDDGAPLGYASGRTFPSLWSQGPELHLEDLFVRAEARGGGVGGRLIDFVLERARTLGCKAVGLHTNERNEVAQAFYRQHGFAPVSEPAWEGGRELYWARRLGRLER